MILPLQKFYCYTYSYSPTSRPAPTPQVDCHTTCHTWQTSLPPLAPLSPELHYIGGYAPLLTDVFGESHQLCGLGQGMTRSVLGPGVSPPGAQVRHLPGTESGALLLRAGPHRAHLPFQGLPESQDTKSPLCQDTDCKKESPQH